MAHPPNNQYGGDLMAPVHRYAPGVTALDVPDQGRRATRRYASPTALGAAALPVTYITAGNMVVVNGRRLRA